MTGGECIRERLYHIRKQPCDESAKSRKDERSKNNEDKAHCDFRRKNIALRPAGHPPGISPLRGEDEDHDKWRDECEIIEGEQRERTTRARLTGYERKNGYIYLTRAERIEKRHEKSAADTCHDNCRSAPARFGHDADKMLHAVGQLKCNRRRHFRLTIAKGISNA